MQRLEDQFISFLLECNSSRTYASYECLLLYHKTGNARVKSIRYFERLTMTLNGKRELAFILLPFYQILQ